MTNVFVAATRQHVGKTSVCLGLVQGLKTRFASVGFLKPIGQDAVQVRDAKGFARRVDRDTPLFKEMLGAVGAYEDMSPVTIGRGATKRLVRSSRATRAETTRAFEEKILRSYTRVASMSEFQVVEGTGHSEWQPSSDLTDVRL